MKLENVIRSVGAEAPHIDPALLDRDVDSFSIDSREVKAGDVFFALSQPEYRDNGFNGEFDDATAFAATAFAAGAEACILRRDRFAEHAASLERWSDRLIFVDDAIAALQRLAHDVYLGWNKPVVAVTGSAGKTTAKELIAQVLAASGRKVLRNIKNYNNGLGHPLTVLKLAHDPSYDVAVLEMGMSTPMNEIARLCRITPPDVGVELNVLPVHVEHLGSIENVAKAKAELIEGLKPAGVAVLNADDPRVASMASLASGRIIFYGIEREANVMATNIQTSGFGRTRFDLTIDGQLAETAFPLNGKHNILNALAAAAVAHSFGMNVGEVASSLAGVAGPPQRGDVLRFRGGFTVINDSYNSNPDALLSMIRTVVDNSTAGARKIVVAGEMLELGREGEAIHKRVGAAIAGEGIDILIGVRGLAKELVDGAAAAGMGRAVFAEDSAAAAEMLLSVIKEGDVVLVKGSRGVRTEQVVDKLLEKFELEGNGAAAV